MKKHRPALPAVAAALGLLLLCGPAEALDWSLAARSGLVQSDNLAQAPPVLADDALIGVLELNGAVEHATRTMLLDLEASNSFRYFFDDRYDAENRTDLRGTFEWQPIRDYLRISVRDTFGQLALNPAEGLLPSQYENANVLTVGPTVLLPLGADTRVIATGEYRVASFSESPINTQRRHGILSVERGLSRLFTLFASVSAARIDFDISGTSSGYDVRAGELGIDAIGRRTALGLSAGVDVLDFGGEKFTGAKFQADMERRLTRNTRLFLTARREVTDSAQVFELGQITDPALTSIRDVQVTAQPMLRSQYRFGWVWSGSRTDVNLLAGLINEKFDSVPQDPLLTGGANRTVREFGAGVGYRFDGGSVLNGNVEMLREHFQAGLRSNDLFLTLTYSRQMTQKLGMELQAQRIERYDSPRDFRELRFYALFNYAFRELREPASVVFDRAFERRTERGRLSGSRADPSGADEQ